MAGPQAAPTASLFGLHSTRIEEIINKSIGVFLPSLDEVWRSNIVTSQGVGAVGDLGRDWKILKVYHGSLTGVIEPSGPQQDWPLYGDPSLKALGNKIYLQNVNQTFPDATKGPNPKPYRLGIPMRAMTTALMTTLSELQAEATPAFIGGVLAPKFTGFARNVAQTLCNYWYLSQNNYYRLSNIADESADITYEDSNKTAIINLQGSDAAIDRFFVGQRLNIYDSTGATQRVAASGTGVFYVTYVDELQCVIKLKDENDVALNAISWADGDIIVFASSKGTANTPWSDSPYFTGIAGVNSWLKSGATTNDSTQYLLGEERDVNNQIDLTVHPEFKSFTKALGSQPLTEHMLRKILRRFHMAKMRYGQTIDTLIASDGVWLAYEKQKIGREYLDRTGRLSSISTEGTSGGFNFTFDGRSYQGKTSMWVEANTVYGIKVRGGNWKRYVPPDPRGARRDPRQMEGVPFRIMTPILTGTNALHAPIGQVNAAGHTMMTEAMQIVGWLRMQLVPDQPAGLKLTGVSEDRIWSDA